MLCNLCGGKVTATIWTNQEDSESVYCSKQCADHDRPWPEKKWVDRFLKMAQHVATWSRDPSTQCGAVIVDAKRRVVSLGYNGFPRGVLDDEERYNDRECKYEMVVHAEANALLNSSRSVAGCGLFTTHPLCNECSKLVIQAGIRYVVTTEPDSAFMERWRESYTVTKTMMSEAGIPTLNVVTPEPASDDVAQVLDKLNACSSWEERAAVIRALL